MNKLKSKWLLLSIIGVFLLSGCTQRHALTYTPIIEKQPPNQIQICLDDITDLRDDKAHIAFMRNVFHIPIFKIESMQSLPSWISYALETELGNAGYKVDFSKDNNAYSITGTVRSFFIDGFLSPNTDIEMELSLLKNKEPIFNKTYSFNESYDLEELMAKFNIKEDAMTSIPEIYLQNVCREFIQDVNDHLLNHPEESSNEPLSSLGEKALPAP